MYIELPIPYFGITTKCNDALYGAIYQCPHGMQLRCQTDSDSVSCATIFYITRNFHITITQSKFDFKLTLTFPKMKLQFILFPLVTSYLLPYGPLYIIDQNLQLVYGSESRIQSLKTETTNVYDDTSRLETFLGTLSFRMKRLVNRHPNPLSRRTRRQ